MPVFGYLGLGLSMCESGMSILFGLRSMLVSFLSGDLVFSLKAGKLLVSSAVSYNYLLLVVFFC